MLPICSLPLYCKNAVHTTRTHTIEQVQYYKNPCLNYSLHSANRVSCIEPPPLASEIVNMTLFCSLFVSFTHASFLRHPHSLGRFSLCLAFPISPKKQNCTCMSNQRHTHTTHKLLYQASRVWGNARCAIPASTCIMVRSCCDGRTETGV